MKKILISALLAMFLLIAFENVKACDPGFSEGQVSFTYKNCDFIVDYCYRIYQGQIEIIITRVWAEGMDTPTGGNCRYLFTQIERHTIINAEILHKLANNNILPPCPSNLMVDNVVIKHANCFKYFGFGKELFGISFNNCTDGLCNAYYKVCADYSTNPPTVNSIFVRTEADVSTCPYDPYGVLYSPIPEEIPDGEYWETPCFFMECIL